MELLTPDEFFERIGVEVPDNVIRNLEAATRPCGMCGESFLVVHRGTVYCSDECRAGIERQRSGERWKGKSKGLRQYTPRRKEQGDCLTCGATFLADPRQRYCSIRCRPSFRRNNNAKRKLAYLIKRDGGRCRLCGKKVNLKATASDPRSPTADHIVPRSEGGGDERANLQLAHWGCNTKKGAGRCGSQLLLLG